MTHDVLKQISFNLVPLLLLWVCWRWKGAGRLCFAALFFWAGVVNLYTAFASPRAYLYFAEQTQVELYQRFIRGPFARHITSFVGGIAVGQLIVGILVALRGKPVRLGLLGAVVFLLAMVPLGEGAGFPAPLFMIAAAALLLPEAYPRTLLETAWAAFTAEPPQRRRDRETSPVRHRS